MRGFREILHPVIHGVDSHSLSFYGQVGINGGSGRRVMVQVVLDDPHVKACFEEMGGIRMAKGTN